MTGLEVHLLRFRAEVVTPLRLPPAAGAALRGALFGTLRRQFCLAGQGPGCGQPSVAGSCPVCFLLAPVDESDRRGRDVPRPYVLRPPSRRNAVYAPGDTLEFELATFGRALGHFPYALLGIEEMGRAGMGAQRAGEFRLDEVWANNPLRGRQEAVYLRERGPTVRPPSLPVGEADVQAEVAALTAAGGAKEPTLNPSYAATELTLTPSYAAAEIAPDGPGVGGAMGLTLTFETPLRLVAAGQLVKPEGFTFRVFFGRLLERVTALAARYAGAPPPPDVLGLLRLAEQVDIAERRLVWAELFRGSGRHQRALPMGGLVGSVTLRGDLAPFLPWLVWGTLTHVGKDAAMGNGRYRLTPAAPAGRSHEAHTVRSATNREQPPDPSSPTKDEQPPAPFSATKDEQPALKMSFHRSVVRHRLMATQDSSSTRGEQPQDSAPTKDEQYLSVTSSTGATQDLSVTSRTRDEQHPIVSLSPIGGEGEGEGAKR